MDTAVPQLRKLYDFSGTTLMIWAMTLGAKLVQNNAVGVISKTRKNRVSS